MFNIKEVAFWLTLKKQSLKTETETKALPTEQFLKLNDTWTNFLVSLTWVATAQCNKEAISNRRLISPAPLSAFGIRLNINTKQTVLFNYFFALLFCEGSHDEADIRHRSILNVLSFSLKSMYQFKQTESSSSSSTWAFLEHLHLIRRWKNRPGMHWGWISSRTEEPTVRQVRQIHQIQAFHEHMGAIEPERQKLWVMIRCDRKTCNCTPVPGCAPGIAHWQDTPAKSVTPE